MRRMKHHSELTDGEKQILLGSVKNEARIDVEGRIRNRYIADHESRVQPLQGDDRDCNNQRNPGEGYVPHDQEELVFQCRPGLRLPGDEFGQHEKHKTGNQPVSDKNGQKWPFFS